LGGVYPRSEYLCEGVEVAQIFCTEGVCDGAVEYCMCLCMTSWGVTRSVCVRVEVGDRVHHRVFTMTGAYGDITSFGAEAIQIIGIKAVSNSKSGNCTGNEAVP